MSPRSILEIDLNAIDHNLRTMRRLVGSSCELGAIVKADAYGMGAARLVGTMQHAGVGRFIVFAPEEAEALLEARPTRPILVLMPVSSWTAAGAFEQALRRGQAELVVHSARQIEALAVEARRRGCVIPVHLEVDTGMSRGGCGPDQAAELLSTVSESTMFELRGVMTHFASADIDPEKTSRQTQRFDDFLIAHRHLMPADCLIHLANSFATMRSAALHRTMVRIGSSWGGIGPEVMQSWDESIMPAPLRPALTWRSRVSHVRMIEAQTTVGYGGRWTAPRASRIGIIPVGYADGYHHALGATDARPAGAVVRVLGGPEAPAWAPVVGAVNMDQIAVDLTDLPATVAEGTEVELISADRHAPNHVTALARIAGTIPHVLLSQLHPRVFRSYIRSPAPQVEVKPAVGRVELAATA